MILVIVGLMSGFERLVKAMDEIAGTLDEEVIMQIGETTYLPKNTKYFRFISEEEINRLYEQSRVVVCHAGVGSIINALMRGKPLIIVPRLMKWGEHSDDHQLEIAKEMGRSGKIKVVYDINTLEGNIKEIDLSYIRTHDNNNKLVQSLTKYLQSLEVI